MKPNWFILFIIFIISCEDTSDEKESAGPLEPGTLPNSIILKDIPLTPANLPVAVKKIMTPSPIKSPPKKAGRGVKLEKSIIMKLFL